MSLPPLIMIVGDDALAERVCAELTAGGLNRVHVVSRLTAERTAAFSAAGAVVTQAAPDNDESLFLGGVGDAASILTLSNDDELNLAVALRARMLNPHIRTVLRQFSPKIGRKIEQNLPNATVLSPASHSAATYAGATLDPGCFFGLRFPALDGDFVGFSEGNAGDLGVRGMRVDEAQARLGARIVALGARHEPPGDTTILEGDSVVTFGALINRRIATHERGRSRTRANVAFGVGRSLNALGRLNPILRTIVLGAATFYACVLLFFHFVMGSTWARAVFDLVDTVTNTGFGDASLAPHGAAATFGAVVAMIGGTIFTSIFIGYVSSAITRAQWIAWEGLRRIHARGHVVVCGGGRTGGAVVDLLVAAGKHVVVIDSHPDPGLVRRARANRIDLLTGDATHEDVLELCGIPNAACVVALTNSDPGNLEIALGARALRADVPLVVRMENRTFAQATNELFGISTFSPAELSAPALAGLARFPGTLGRVSYAGSEHTIVQRERGDAWPATDAVPLCAWRDGHAVVVLDAPNPCADDAVLFAVPLRRTFGSAAAFEDVAAARDTATR